MAILTVDGVLDTSNSAALRDHILQATLDEPAAVIVNISALKVLAELAWSTFIGAHWQVRSKPNVPIVLVCAHRGTREAIARSGVAYFIPVYSTEKAAMKALSQHSRRAVRRADAPLPADLTSLRESRRLVREWLTTWSQSTLIPVALVVVNVFVENVLEHTASVPVMRIESHGATATIAVSATAAKPRPGGCRRRRTASTSPAWRSSTRCHARGAALPPPPARRCGRSSAPKTSSDALLCWEPRRG